MPSCVNTHTHSEVQLLADCDTSPQEGRQSSHPIREQRVSHVTNKRDHVIGAVTILEHMETGLWRSSSLASKLYTSSDLSLIMSAGLYSG